MFSGYTASFASGAAVCAVVGTPSSFSRVRYSALLNNNPRYRSTQYRVVSLSLLSCWYRLIKHTLTALPYDTTPPPSVRSPNCDSNQRFDRNLYPAPNIPCYGNSFGISNTHLPPLLVHKTHTHADECKVSIKSKDLIWFV